MSSTPFAEAFVEIAVDNARLRQELNGETKGIFQAGVTGLVAGVAASLTTGLISAVSGALGGVKNVIMGQLSEGLTAAIEAEEVDAKLGAVVKATGQNAGFAAEELIEMANALESVSTHGDEAIKSAQTVLLTFKSLKGNQFREAQDAAADLASFLGVDMATAARGLGRAMEDPETGLRALKQAGVVFNDEQVQTIKKMMETGQVVKAQQMVLDGLRERIGGVAQTMAGTFGGAIQQMKNQLGNMQEGIGRGLMPILRPWLDAAKQFFVDMQKNEPAILEIFDNISKGVLGVAERLGLAGGSADEFGKDLSSSLSQVLDFLSLFSRDWDALWQTMGRAVELYIGRAVAVANAKLGLIVGFARGASNKELEEYLAKQGFRDSGDGEKVKRTVASLSAMQKRELAAQMVHDNAYKEVEAYDQALGKLKGMTNERLEQARLARDAERMQKKLNAMSDQAEAKLRQQANMSPLDLLKGAMTGTLPPELRRQIDVQRAFGKEVMPMPAEVGAGGEAAAGPGGGAGAWAWGLGQQFFGIGQALTDTVMKFKKSDEKVEPKFVGLGDMHKQLQATIAGKGRELPQIADNTKGARDELKDVNKNLKALIDKPAGPAVFA